MSEVRSLLPIAELMEKERIDVIVHALQEAWTSTMGQPPADLDTDLEVSRRFFDPVAQGQRLRRELNAIPPHADALFDPGEPFTLAFGPRKWVVTPEGRCALDLLAQNLKEGRSRRVTDQQLALYDRRLAHLYQRWGRHRLRSVIDLLAGATKPLQIPAAGVVIALLVNGSLSEARAMRRASEGNERPLLDRAFFAPVEAFAKAIAPPSRRNETANRLISGWILYEARRRLGEGFVVVNSRTGGDGKVWIEAGSVDEVVDSVARDLARGHRPQVTEEKFSDAFDALVRELRDQQPILAGFGLAHERPRTTLRLKRQFLDRLAHHLGDDS